MPGMQEARDTLLRALEQLDNAEKELEGSVERVDLIVIYSVGREDEDLAWEEMKGWSVTPGPKWMHRALLEQAVDAFDVPVVSIDSEDEDD